MYILIWKINISLVRHHTLSLLLILLTYINLHSVRRKESLLLQQLRADLKDKRMIVSKDQMHLSSVVGQGKQ